MTHNTAGAFAFNQAGGQTADDADTETSGDDVEISDPVVVEGPDEPTQGTPAPTPSQARAQRRERRLERRAQQVSEQSVPRRIQTAAEAFIPAIPGVELGVEDRGRRARRDVRAVASQTEGAAGTTLDFLGPPQTDLGATAEAGLALIPFAGKPLAVGTRGVLRTSSRRAAREGAERIAQRTAGEAVETAAPRIAREGAQEVAEGGARRAGRETAERAATREAATEGAEGVTRTGARRAGREAAEEAAPRAAREGSERVIQVGSRSVTKKQLAAAGIGAGAAGLTAAALLGGSDTEGGGQGDGGPFGPEGGDPTGPGAGAGGPGSGPFGDTGVPGVLELGFLDRIGAGIGSAFDGIGQGIGDALRALGIPIGEGAGKAIAIGGALLLIAIAVRETGVLKGGAAPKLGASGTPPRGPDGKFRSVT